MTNFDITSILPLLMGNMGGGQNNNGCGLDSNAMLIKVLMDSMKKSPADKYFNPNGGPCPPPKNNNNMMVEMLLKSMLQQPPVYPNTTCCCSPQNHKENPCGFSPISPWCGNNILYILAMIMGK